MPLSSSLCFTWRFDSYTSTKKASVAFWWEFHLKWGVVRRVDGGLLSWDSGKSLRHRPTKSLSKVKSTDCLLLFRGCVWCAYTGWFTPFITLILGADRLSDSYFKHLYKHSHVTVTNIVAHLISKTKSCSCLSRRNRVRSFKSLIVSYSLCVLLRECRDACIVSAGGSLQVMSLIIS